MRWRRTSQATFFTYRLARSLAHTTYPRTRARTRRIAHTTARSRTPPHAHAHTHRRTHAATHTRTDAHTHRRMHLTARLADARCRSSASSTRRSGWGSSWSASCPRCSTSRGTRMTSRLSWGQWHTELRGVRGRHNPKAHCAPLLRCDPGERSTSTLCPGHNLHVTSSRDMHPTAECIAKLRTLVLVLCSVGREQAGAWRDRDAA